MGQAPIHLILYGTQGCHLCEEATHILRDATEAAPRHLVIQPIDIAHDTDLIGRYGIRIPVLMNTATGDELDWPFDADKIRALLAE